MGLDLGFSLAHHDSLNRERLAAGIVAFDDHRTETRVAGSWFEANWHVVQEAPDHELFFHANHAVIRAGHAYVGNVGGAAGKYSLVGGRDVSMSSDYGGHSPVRITGQGDFVGSGLSINTQDNNHQLN